MRINNSLTVSKKIPKFKINLSEKSSYNPVSFKNSSFTDNFSINNFYQVDEKLCRGRQPGICQGEREAFTTDINSVKKDLQALKNMGIGTVIDLRYKDYEGVYPEIEGFIAKRLGMKHHRIPMNGEIPTPEQIFNIFQIIQKSESPSFLHCRAGRDRTGMVLCLYSTYVQGKNPEKVLKEVFDDKNVIRFFYLKSEEKQKFLQIINNMYKLGQKNNSKIDLLTMDDLSKAFTVKN
ncbi:MAG: tyrosine-protein phosphatase [Candidatus Gastranaerophilales bacterium]|nr:tyrosine-protein phosphatase [Candidatus Gastranaerophilales bacterium]